MKKVLIAEKGQSISIQIGCINNVSRASDFSGVQAYLEKMNFDIVVIDVEISENDFPVIEKMAKKSQVIISYGAIFDIDAKIAKQFFCKKIIFFFNNKDEAIDTICNYLEQIDEEFEAINPFKQTEGKKCKVKKDIHSFWTRWKKMRYLNSLDDMQWPNRFTDREGYLRNLTNEELVGYLKDLNYLNNLRWGMFIGSAISCLLIWLFVHSPLIHSLVSLIPH